MTHNFSYILGFSIANIIWSLEVMGEMMSYFATFSLMISFLSLMLLYLEKTKKYKIIYGEKYGK